MQEEIIIAKNITKTFITGTQKVTAIDKMTFNIKKGEFVVILGPSGAGKTTILNLLGGMDTPTSGQLISGSTKLAKIKDKDLTNYRRNKVGFVFQFYNLIPNLTALENVELATELCPDHLSPEEVLTKVGLKSRMHNFPSQLSGGEQQRVSIARAVAKNPDILLCDEPTGALDYETGKLILSLLHDICKQENKAVIIVTHNSAIKDMADRVIHIKNGKIVAEETNEKPINIEDLEW